MVLVLTARNALLVVLLGWLLRELWRVGSPRVVEREAGLPAVALLAHSA